jgi:hypothetical protein
MVSHVALLSVAVFPVAVFRAVGIGSLLVGSWPASVPHAYDR